MKYHRLGTFCILITVIGVTATARADFSTNVPANRSDRSTELGTAGSSDGQSTPSPVMNSLELAIYQQVNQYRQSQHLPPLVVDPAISAQAKAHSEAMAKVGNLSHDGFHERIDLVSDTIAYKSAAENVASNRGYHQPDVTAVQSWIESPGHLHNMIGLYDLTGIGVAQNAKGEYYFTQIFIRKG